MKAAVLGSPIAHSLSPVLHTAAYAALGLDDWSYAAIECEEDGLPGLLDGLGPGWAGLSLTMPLKRAVLPLLDEIDSLAADVGGANTIVLRDGRRRGYNTDVGGMVDALAGAGVTGAGVVTPARTLIIGAGATACSALAALRHIGIRAVDVAVRDLARAGHLLATARRLGVQATPHDLAAAGHLPAAGLVICAVPPRAADSLVPRLAGKHGAPPFVFDVAYEPWPTRLAAAASAEGSAVIGGFELLLHQAARQVELMTGHQPPLHAMRAAVLAELAARAGGATRRAAV